MSYPKDITLAQRKSIEDMVLITFKERSPRGGCFMCVIDMCMYLSIPVDWTIEAMVNLMLKHNFEFKWTGLTLRMSLSNKAERYLKRIREDEVY